MSCDTHEEALALHADGALPEAERGALEAHLQSCPSCARELAELRALLGDLRVAPDDARPPQPFVARTVEAATRARRRTRLAAGAFGLSAIAATAAAWLLLAPVPPPAELRTPDEAAWLAALGGEDEEEDDLEALGLDEFDDDALDELVALSEG